MTCHDERLKPKGSWTSDWHFWMLIRQKCVVRTAANRQTSPTPLPSQKRMVKESLEFWQRKGVIPVTPLLSSTSHRLWICLWKSHNFTASWISMIVTIPATVFMKRW
jgi:hypothetical protein